MREMEGDSRKTGWRIGSACSSFLSIFITTVISLLLRLVVVLSEFSARVAGTAQRDGAKKKDDKMHVSLDDEEEQRRERLKQSIAVRTSEIVDARRKGISQTIQPTGMTQENPGSRKGIRVIDKDAKVVMRPATVEDTGLVLTFIKELARFEEMEDSVVASNDILLESLFPKSDGRASNAKVVILEIDGAPAGFVLYFYNFSTFLGKRGLYIEDLYVREEFRGRGFGRQLLKHVCEIALKENCGRVEWWCLDWNKSAIQFYLGLGAEAMSDWTVYRLSEESISRIAAGTA